MVGKKTIQTERFYPPRWRSLLRVRGVSLSPTGGVFLALDQANPGAERRQVQSRQSRVFAYLSCDHVRHLNNAAVESVVRSWADAAERAFVGLPHRLPERRPIRIDHRQFLSRHVDVHDLVCDQLGWTCQRQRRDTVANTRISKPSLHMLEGPFGAITNKRECLQTWRLPDRRIELNVGTCGRLRMFERVFGFAPEPSASCRQLLLKQLQITRINENHGENQRLSVDVRGPIKTRIDHSPPPSSSTGLSLRARSISTLAHGQKLRLASVLATILK